MKLAIWAVAACLLLTATAVYAQSSSSEQRLVDRLLNPSLDQSAPTDFSQSFIDGRTVQTRGARTTTFPFLSRFFSSRDFQTRSFHDRGSFWGGDFQFQRSDTSVPNVTTSRDADRAMHGTSQEPNVNVRPLPQSDRSVAIPYQPTPRRGRMEGKSQEYFDRFIQPSVQPQLSIDDVRTILNRN